MTVPSPGMTSPASTTTTSPRCSSAAGRVVPSCSRASVSERIARSASACALPRPSASASARLANTTVSHSQNVDGEREPRGLVAAAQRLAAEQLDQPGDRRDHGADLDHEHHRVAELDARVELRQRAPGSPGHRSRRLNIEARYASAGSLNWRCPVEGEVELERRSRRARRARRGAAVGVVVDQLARRVASGSLRTAAMRWAWMRALATEMCGSTPEADVVTASTGTCAGVQPGVYGRSSARYGGELVAVEVPRGGLVGPAVGEERALAV